MIITDQTLMGLMIVIYPTKEMTYVDHMFEFLIYDAF